MVDPEHSAARAWELLIGLLQAERPQFAKLCAEFDVTQVELHVIKSIKDDGGCGKMQDLIDLHDKSTITRAVGRLVQRGLVARRENPEDRREKLVEFTEQGEELRERLIERLKTPPVFVSRLSVEDRNTLVEVLERAMQWPRES